VLIVFGFIKGEKGAYPLEELFIW